MTHVFDRRRFLKTVLLTLVAAALIAWGNGYVDGYLAPKGNALTVALGDAAGLLEVAVEDHWNAYDVVFRRGPATPHTPAETERLIQKSRETELVRRIIDGGVLRVRLCDKDGEIIESAALDLSWVRGTDINEVVVRLKKHRQGALLRLGIDDGR